MSHLGQTILPSLKSSRKREPQIAQRGTIVWSLVILIYLLSFESAI